MSALRPGPTGRAMARFDRAAERGADRLRGRRQIDRAFYLASELGDFSLCWHLLGAARGLTSDRAADEAVRLSAVLGLESLLVNQGIKPLFRRTRPAFEGVRPHRLRAPRTSSFPSGHASSAFCAASLLGEGRRTRPLYFLAAAAVSYSRVHVRIHHASDVVAGAAVGLVIARVARAAWPRPAGPPGPGPGASTTPPGEWPAGAAALPHA